MIIARLDVQARRVWNYRWSKYHGKPYPQPRSIAFADVPDQSIAAEWYWEVGVKVLGLEPALSPMVLIRPIAQAFYQEFRANHLGLVDRLGLGAALRAHTNALDAAGARVQVQAKEELP